MPRDRDPSAGRPPAGSPSLTGERRVLFDRIVAEGDRRRQTRLVGGSAFLVLVIAMVAATLTVVGEGDSGRQLVAAGGGASTSVAPAGVTTPGPAEDPASTSTVPSTVPVVGAGSPTTTVSPPPSTTLPPAALPGAWGALPPSGVAPRFDGVRAWTGRELLVWAGETGVTDALCATPCGPLPVFDGVAFNPSSNSWRRMAPGPVPAAAGPLLTIPGGAWTGSELVIWGGAGAPVSAAYDPGRDSWRTLPTGPLAGGRRPAVVALGDEVVVVRTGAANGPGAAALDPSTGTWRVVADPPANSGLVEAGVAGGEVVLVLRSPDYEGVLVAALSASGQWRVVARVPDATDAAVIAAGRAWLVSCAYSEGLVAEVAVKGVSVADGTTTERAGPVAGGCPTLAAAGAELLVLTPMPDEYQPESLRAHQLSGGGWRELNRAPAGRVGDATWTGSEVFFWGGCACGGMAGSAIEAGFRLRL